MTMCLAGSDTAAYGLADPEPDLARPHRCSNPRTDPLPDGHPHSISDCGAHGSADHQATKPVPKSHTDGAPYGSAHANSDRAPDHSDTHSPSHICTDPDSDGVPNEVLLCALLFQPSYS